MKDYLSNDEKGDLAELEAASDAKSVGADVFLPFGKSKVDMIVFIGGSTYKTQVKVAKHRDGEPNNVRAILRSEGGYDYHGIVDAFILYNKHEDECYWLWPEQVAKTVASVCTVSPEHLKASNRERATFSKDVMMRDVLEELQN